MLKIRRIRGLRQAITFQKAAQEFIGIEFPLSYLRRSKMFGLYDSKDDLKGGFLILMEGDLRSFQSLTSLEYLPKHIDRWDVAEVNSLWLSPELRKGFVSVMFWLFIISQLLISGKKYFAYTYSSHKVRLRRFYARANPIRIYEGKTKCLEGMVEEENESIEIVSRLGIALAPFSSIKLIILRALIGMFRILRVVN